MTTLSERLASTHIGRLFNWTRTRQPGPGAQSYAFHMGLQFAPAASMGNIYMRGLRPLPPAVQVFTSAATLTSGYGGVSAGTLALQGLIDPNAQNATPANQ